MSRLILKYAYPITFVILAILAWTVYRIFSAGGSGLIGFVVVTVIVWGLGTVVFLYLWPTASGASLLATGTDDVLYIGGSLDLSKGPQVLHVPDMAGRYYSVQFTDPSDGVDFAYVGTRVTGTEAGDYLISGPRWTGTVPQGMAQIASPN